MPKRAPANETFQCPFCTDGTLWIRPADVLHSNPPCAKFSAHVDDLPGLVAAIAAATKAVGPS